MNFINKFVVIFVASVVVSSVLLAADGKEVYMQTCVACHGEDGTGALPGTPDFTDAEGRLSQNDAVLIKNMREGVQSVGSPMAMPAKGGNSNLNDDDLKNVLVYMRTRFL